MKALTISAVIVTVVEVTLILIALTRCLPDTPDRFFMGRGSHGQCLYMDMDMESREVHE